MHFITFKSVKCPSISTKETNLTLAGNVNNTNFIINVKLKIHHECPQTQKHLHNHHNHLQAMDPNHLRSRRHRFSHLCIQTLVGGEKKQQSNKGNKINMKHLILNSFFYVHFNLNFQAGNKITKVKIKYLHMWSSKEPPLAHRL